MTLVPTAPALPGHHQPCWNPWEVRLGREYRLSHITCFYGCRRLVVADTTSEMVGLALACAELHHQYDRHPHWEHES